jgi:DNA-directed RNA polymerase subunit RPC12/RpoP/transcription elongation factor Elf1
MSENLEYRKCDCVHCGQNIEFPNHGVGMDVECPTCHRMTRLFSDPKYLPKMAFTQRPGSMRISSSNLSAIPTGEESLYQAIYEMPHKSAFWVCLCEHCSQQLEFPPIGMWRTAKCPACGRETSLGNMECANLISRYTEGLAREADAKYAESLRKVTCPNCGVPYEYDVYQPSKPWVLTPMSFTGIMMGGIANAMADHIFKAENVCRNCGHRWPCEE